MGYEPSYYNKINVHVRGVYDSKIKAMDRFCDRFHQLSEGCRKRLTVENDDTPTPTLSNIVQSAEKCERLYIVGWSVPGYPDQSIPGDRSLP